MVCGGTNRTLAACLLITLFWSADAASRLAAAENRPNILWITCEDASPNLGCYGDSYARTPNLDRLAAEGVRYDRATSCAGVCAIARSTLITGMYASTLGSQHMRSNVELPDGISTFTAELRKAGYYCTNNAKTDYNFKVPADAWDDNGGKGHWRNRPPGKPFFSVFNLTITHESRLRGPASVVAELAVADRHDPAQANLPAYLPDTPEARREWARYADLMTLMDRQAGEILEQLKSDGLDDDTIVFFFSDHGVGLPRAKQWIYEAGVRVPLIVRFPERYGRFAPAEPGSSVTRLVSFVDFGPTVLSLAGVSIPRHMQGEAFLGEQAQPPRKYVYGIRDRMDERIDVSRTVTSQRYKYQRNYMPHRPHWPWLDYMEQLATSKAWRRLSAEGKLQPSHAFFVAPAKPLEELYDLQVDPDEMVNLADSSEHQSILIELRDAHFQWVRQTKDLGLVPEHQMHDAAASGAPYAVARTDEETKRFDERFAAAQLVGQDASHLPQMLAALDDTDAAVRYWAAIAILNLGDAGQVAVPHLQSHLHDTSPEVRIIAAESLCCLGHQQAALPVLTGDLQHKNSLVRLAAANSLDALGEIARPVLAEMRTAATSPLDTDRYTRWVLAHALRQLGETAETENSDPTLAKHHLPPRQIGIAKIDITPQRPIRLSGYGQRRQPADTVSQTLWAKAMVMGSNQRGPCVLITADLVGIPDWLSDELAKRLQKSVGISRDRLAICATHTHTGPALRGVLPFIFGEPVPAEHQREIDRYSAELLDKLEKLVLAAIEDRRPSRLAWGQGKAGFAFQRRELENGRWVRFGEVADGATDRDLPLLRVVDTDGNLRAVLINYACHCTTLGGDFNQFHGDWAGEAAKLIEQRHPNTMAMVAIGCGADANPFPRSQLKEVAENGKTIADEVDRLLTQELKPIGELPTCRFEKINLPMDEIPPRDFWQQAAQPGGRPGYYARVVLERLDRGESLPTTVPLPVQSWMFGDELAMVFLGGEIVADYSLRLKRELDGSRLWVNAYANALPGYIVSRRMLAEGGYEVDNSRNSYDMPARLSETCEDLIVDAVKSQLGATFARPEKSACRTQRPNILVIFSDDHGQQAISAYGSKLIDTPGFDRLAREGMLFRNSFVTNSICGPSRAVFLTGKHSHLNRMTENIPMEFDGSQQTFPKLIRQAGYQTALIGKWHLGGTPTGFDHYDILPGQGEYYDPVFITEQGKQRHRGYASDLTTDKSIAWLKANATGDKPFLLMCQHKAPHAPWDPAPRHLKLFADRKFPEPSTLLDDFAGRTGVQRQAAMSFADLESRLFHLNLEKVPAEYLPALQAAYGDENAEFAKNPPSGDELTRWYFQRFLKDYLRTVTALDENIARLLDYLDESGLAGNTLVLYASDQGYYLGEHGWVDKRWMYEESLRTPLLVRWPGVVKPQSECDAMVQNLDYAPTLLAAAGIHPPADMQGRSLLPLLRGETPDDWRQSIYYHFYENRGWGTVPRHEGVRTATHKLIHFYDDEVWELFDLSQDPLETRNLFNDKVLDTARRTLASELNRLKAFYGVADISPEPPLDPN